MTVCSSHQTMSPCNFIQNFGALEDSIWTLDRIGFQFQFSNQIGPTCQPHFSSSCACRLLSLSSAHRSLRRLLPLQHAPLADELAHGRHSSATAPVKSRPPSQVTSLLSSTSATIAVASTRAYSMRARKRALKHGFLPYLLPTRRCVLSIDTHAHDFIFLCHHCRRARSAVAPPLHNTGASTNEPNGSALAPWSFLLHLSPGEPRNSPHFYFFIFLDVAPPYPAFIGGFYRGVWDGGAWAIWAAS
jgi:hypothetical protein